MKISMRTLLLATLIVLALFSLPLWLPGLLVNQAAAQGQLNPSAESSLILLDGGWFTGQNEYHMIAVPQVLAWIPGSAEATWATETGFLYGGLLNEDGTRLYLIEHRKLGVDSLRNLTFSENELSRPHKDWGVFLTKLDPNTGRVINRSKLPDPPYKNYSDVTLAPLAIQGDILYLINYSTKNNLFAYNLRAGEFENQAWTTCELGYPMRTVFIESSNRVASLCIDYSSGESGSWITIVSLDAKQSDSIEIPPLGKEDFETGNGLILTQAGNMFVIDTDAGVLVQIDAQKMQLGKPISYLESLPQQESSLSQRIISSLLELGAEPAYAKRWMGLSAISPDGRWLAVDSGLGETAANNRKPGVVLIDLDSLKATQLVQLVSTPSSLAFANEETLLVFFEKNSSTAPLRGLQIDLATGKQTTFSFQINGWLHSILVHH